MGLQKRLVKGLKNFVRRDEEKEINYLKGLKIKIVKSKKEGT